MSAWHRCVLALFTLVPAIAGADENTAQAPESLREVYQGAFRVGVAAGTSLLADEADQALVKTHFNAFTLENELKWDHIHPEEGHYNFGPADALVDFARANGMEVTGHTLVWNQQTPDWVFRDEQGNLASSDVVLARLRDHIHTVMTHFKGRVKGWDVVNEALGDTAAEKLRDSPWLRTIGDDYVLRAFRLAHEADPDVELYYNDYNLEDTVKRTHAVRLIKRLKAEGLRIDGVGLQGHYQLPTVNTGAVASTIQTFAALGLRVNISELDLSVYGMLDRSNRFENGLPDALLQLQADTYAALFHTFLAHQDAIDRVTFWGVNDGSSWLNNFPVEKRPDYPLLFDSANRPKPAFDAVIAAGSAER
ncbi:MAG: 1,4-beta-xylanase [Candidatus Hydrogenedens sp.]|nr:1,4-beta-xylanase [Candidatus Hydrogenedens sp.]